MTVAVAAKHAVTAYAEAVISGKIVTGGLIRLACQRHLDDLEHGHQRGLRFDEAAADRVLGFFRFLPHIKGEWAQNGGLLELEPWQEFIVGSLFGWKRRDGTRRFRTSYAEIARKNGKSALASGIGLFLAFFDDEPGAEVYAAATKRDQAKIVWGDARQMVIKTPALRQRLVAFVANLHHEASASKFEPLGADADSMDGLNIHGAIVDELHAHKTRAVVDVLETATGARRQPLIFYITTAGYDRHSACWSHHEYSIKVIEGIIQDDTWFAFVAGLDEGDEWADPKVWPKANPNLGISVKLDDLERKCDRAKQVPAEQNAFKRLHLNVWTEQAERWLDIVVWDRGKAAVDADSLAGRFCFGGLDLASTTDIAALVLLFPDDAGGFDLVPYFWVPEDGIRRRAERDRVPYDVWADQGLIRPTPGNVIDYDAIRACLTDEVALRYQLRELGFDPWNATQLVTQLMSDGLTCVPIRQGFASLTAPTKEFEKLVLAGKIRHGGNPVMRWMISNVAVTQDPAGNLKPDKARSSEKIDGVLATILALDRASRNDSGHSVYEERELLVLG